MFAIKSNPKLVCQLQIKERRDLNACSLFMRTEHYTAGLLLAHDIGILETVLCSTVHDHGHRLMQLGSLNMGVALAQAAMRN